MIRRLVLAILLVTLTLAGLAACSAPTLEDPRCAEAQDRVRQFYSLHFDRQGSGVDDTTRPFLTERLVTELAAKPEESGYFTVGGTFPRAFRVGTCTLRNDMRADLDVLMLWRSDEKSEQKRVRVSVAREGDKWAIDTVSPL